MQLTFSGHEGLRYKYSVSCPELDFLIDFAKSNPINHGARMMGGGFGGSTLHLLQSSDVQNIQMKLEKLIMINLVSYPIFLKL
ncbi:MAG: hypothetical protein IPK88_00015 [Saprospiraceae bacterium]|nr:hypothetical protein [Candidatus Defluviibacterium haderslevense]